MVSSTFITLPDHFNRAETMQSRVHTAALRHLQRCGVIKLPTVPRSMPPSCAGMSGLTARDAAAAVAMALLRTEGQDRVTSCAFSTSFSVSS
jgi:hypothetical protein